MFTIIDVNYNYNIRLISVHDLLKDISGILSLFSFCRKIQDASEWFSNVASMMAKTLPSLFEIDLQLCHFLKKIIFKIKCRQL